MPCGYAPDEWKRLSGEQRANAMLAVLVGKNMDLRERVRRLEEDERKSRNWHDDAKRAAGFHENVTFDDVWAKALAAYLATKPDPVT